MTFTPPPPAARGPFSGVTHVQSDLSPKDLADVIGVSESSLKRWVDEGRLTASRTAGGHRRIPMHEAIRFIRQTNADVVKPELLGLPDLGDTHVTGVLSGKADAALYDALASANADLARGLIFAFLVKTRSLAEVCDGPISHAMHRIGELWLHSDRGILVEHRASEICTQTLHQIRQVLRPVPNDAPQAIGGSPSGETHALPSLMASLTLQEVGYRDQNLGANTPIDSILLAAREQRAALIWMSVSSAETRSVVFDQFAPLVACARELGASIVLGGRGVLGHPLPIQTENVHVVNSMSELAAFARARRSGWTPTTRDKAQSPAKSTAGSRR